MTDPTDAVDALNRIQDARPDLFDQAARSLGYEPWQVRYQLELRRIAAVDVTPGERLELTSAALLQPLGFRRSQV